MTPKADFENSLYGFVQSEEIVSIMYNNDSNKVDCGGLLRLRYLEIISHHLIASTTTQT